MTLTGTLTNVKGQSHFNGNDYQFADLMDDAGQKTSLMFINRDVSPLASSRITIEDVSQDLNKIRPVEGKNYDYKIYGTGIQIGPVGQGGASQATQPQARPNAPRRAQNGSQCSQGASDGLTMEDLITYGLDAVDIALHRDPNLPDCLQTAIFNCSMYAIKEKRPLRKAKQEPIPEEQLQNRVENTFDAAPAHASDGEANPFNQEDPADDFPF